MQLATMAFTLFFLQLCSATDTQCTVTRDAEGTLYSVPEFSGEKCDFQWMNGTRDAVADPTGHTDQVVRSCNRSLYINKCCPKMYYARTCEDGLKHEVTCSFNCTINPWASKEGETHWIAAGKITAVVLGLLGLLVLVLGCYKLIASRNRRKKGRGSPENESNEELQQLEA